MTASLYGKRSAHTVASSCGDSGAYPELCENKISVGLGVRIRANQPMSQRVEGDTVNPGTKSLERNKVRLCCLGFVLAHISFRFSMLMPKNVKANVRVKQSNLELKDSGIAH
jgi:hypothetical protein